MLVASSGLSEPGIAPVQRHPLRRYHPAMRAFHWLTAILIFAMICSGVIAKQLDGGPVSDTLFSLHKITGALTLLVVALRLAFRFTRREHREMLPRRSVLHGSLYALVILVPLLGWAGISDFGAREVFGYSLPAIWPEHAGYADLLFFLHAYAAFALLALVAVHIGVAMHDYVMGTHEAEKHGDA
jgi:cytochrome b561